MQATTVIILGILVFMFVVFMVRTPGKITRIIGNSAVRITIGVLFLFFFNVFGANLGFHIPINIFTVAITSILGIFGVGALFMIHLILL